LKKRNKKLLLFAPRRRFKWANQGLPLIGKSFLVLFFKKELLPSDCLPFSVSRSQRELILVGYVLKLSIGLPKPAYLHSPAGLGIPRAT
jgi:hypothetical protein